MTSTENRVAFAQEQNFSQNQDSSDSDNDYPVKAQEIIEPKVVQVKDVPEDDEDDYYVEKYTEEEEEEEVKKGGIKNFLKTQLDKFFVEHIPVESLKELSPAYMYYFGVVAYACAIAFFCYFTYNSYLNATTNAFIAIDKNSGVCNTVPIVITQNFAADNEGNWEGSPAYVYSNGKYDLFLNNFQVGSLGEYQQMMNVFYDSLQNAGKLAKRQNLPYNLILWMSYIRYYSLDDPHQTNFSSIGYGQLQYIQLTGDPSEVFDSRYYQARVGSAAGYCSEYSMTTFDQANTLIETRLNYTSFVANPVCFAAVIPENFGYLSVTDNDVFSMRLEVRAFTTAIAVNFGFIEIDDLGKGDSVDRIFEFRNVTYRLAEYYDTRYPQQDTIQCVQNVSEILEDQTGIESACFYNMGNSLTLPVFHHIGTSYETPSYCDCDTTGKTTQCNEFNLLEALIYYPIEEDSSNPANSANVFARQLQKLMALLVRYPEYSVLNRKAYNATWGAAAPAYQDQAASTKTEAWLENAYNFCLDRNSGDMCSLAVFNSVGLSDHKVSEYKYQLTNGSCVDSVTIDETYWDKLLNNPPTVLTQSYFECYQEPYSAFLDAVGIASGNTSLAVPMTVVFLLPLLYLVLVALRQVPPKEEYKTVEKEEAIEILSILLLRVRDGKTRGLKHNGVLVKLVDELISAAKEEGGYPDSDDDGSDDEELPRKSVSKKRISKRTSSGTTNGQDPDSDDENDGNKNVFRKKRKSRKSRRKSSLSPIVTADAQQNPQGGKKDFRRQKMGVFTKHIEEAIEKQKVNTRRRSSADPQARQSAALATAQTNNNTTFFGYFFGEETKDTNEKSQELSAMGAANPIHGAQKKNSIFGLSSFLDINNPQNIPKGVTVLNNPAKSQSPAKFKRILNNEQVEVLIDDMVSLFAEAFTERTIALAAFGPEGISSPEAKNCIESAKNHFSYIQACTAACKLSECDLTSLLELREDHMFMQLINALSMHASINLGCDMKDVSLKYADIVGYNLGGKLVTLNHLMKMM